MLTTVNLKEKSTVHHSIEAVDNYQPFPLTDVQSAYLIGREQDQVLGGVGCHAYFEIIGHQVDIEKLNQAWNELQRIHLCYAADLLITINNNF